MNSILSNTRLLAFRILFVNLTYLSALYEKFTLRSVMSHHICKQFHSTAKRQLRTVDMSHLLPVLLPLLYATALLFL